MLSKPFWRPRNDSKPRRASFLPYKTPETSYGDTRVKPGREGYLADAVKRSDRWETAGRAKLLGMDGWLVGWLAGWLAGWLVGWLVGMGCLKIGDPRNGGLRSGFPVNKRENRNGYPKKRHTYNQGGDQ